MRRQSRITIFFFSLLIGIYGCITDPPAIQPYILAQPTGFSPMVVPANNPTSQTGVRLGEQLFFDAILSLDSTISCSHCHKPELAFTDGLRVSSGTRRRKGTRSSPSLLNIGFHYKGLFWDGRSPSLEEQVLHPITDSVEMAADSILIVEKLKTHAVYPSLFQAAFGKTGISMSNIAKALAQYQRTLISDDSKFDRVLAGLDSFTVSEQRGYSIFFDAGYPAIPMSECSHCHTDPLFSNLAFENNGLELKDAADIDEGRALVTDNEYDRSKFKVPTLRNIAITAPYMHDGRLRTLEEVLEHYNTGGHYALNVSPNVRPLHFLAQDKTDLINFLHTLTDSNALVTYINRSAD